MPDISKLIFDSSLAGLSQAQDISFNLSLPSTAYAGGEQKTFYATANMASGSNIPDVQVQLTGMSSNWFWLAPLYNFFYPDGSNSSTGQFNIALRTYFVGTTVTVRMDVVEWTFSANTCPAFTLNCRAYVDTAPF